MGKKGRRDEEEALQDYVGLIARHQWALRGFILMLMPGSSDVDDVLQETNIVLWQKRKRFKMGTNFLAWATTIARFQVMRFRGIASRVGALPFSDEFVEDLAEELVPPDSKQPIFAALDQCMGKLGEKQRELLMVRYTPGKSIKEHAERLGTSAEVLRVTLHRVRQALKQCIENTLEGQST